MEFKGISFPFRISSATGGVSTSRVNDSGDNTLIRESLTQIIATKVGERVIEKDFGCDIDLKVFDPLDNVLQQAAQVSIVKAIATWEPRVQITDVKIIPDNQAGKLTIQLSYILRRTGAQDTFQVSL